MKSFLRVVLLLCVFNGAVFGAVYWDNDSGNQRWEDANNWSGDAGPTVYPAIDIGTPNGVDECVIGSGVVADGVTKLWLGFNTGTEGSLLIDGGQLVCNQFLYIAYKGDSTGTLRLKSGSITVELYDVGKYDLGTSLIDMDGGTITTARDFYVGYDEGNATLEMSGGEIHTNKLYVAYDNISSGLINLDGGTICAGSLMMNGNAVLSKIDITAGVLTVTGDITSAIETLADANMIVAYGGAGLLQVDYDITNSGKTTVTASPPPVINPQPADGQKTVAIDADLSWTAAGWEDSFDVYFGSSYDNVSMADHNDLEFQGNYVSPDFNLPILDYETDYFWRIDGVNTEQTGKGKVFSFVTEGYVPACVFWDNDSGDQNWGTVSNWSGDAGAGVNSAVDVSGDTAEPVIGSGVLADQAEQLWIASAPSSEGSLLIDGGTLICDVGINIGFNGIGQFFLESGSVTTSGTNVIGAVDGSQGQFVMNGGSFTADSTVYVGKNGFGNLEITGDIFSTDGLIHLGFSQSGCGSLDIKGGTLVASNAGGIRCGYKGRGVIEMSGGVIDTPKLSIPFDYDDNSAGYMQLDGGVVNAGQLVMGRQGQMDIAGGTMTIDGDVVSVINDYIDGDLIRGYNASGTLHVEYDTAQYPGKTVVYAYPEPVEWVISFEDGFYGGELNEDKWQNPNWNGGSYRFADNVEVAGGNLVLKTILRDINNDGVDEYTSGTISSKYYQRFGYWEASFKICDAPGINNAFWLNTGQFGPDPYNNPQPIAEHTDRIEIDIQECHWPSELNMNLHDWRPVHVGLGSRSVTVADNLAADFHKYSFLWEEDDDVFWYYDDGLKFTNSLAAADSQSLVETLFSTLVIGTPNANTDGSHMDIDWLRVFKRAPNANKPNPSYNSNGVSVGSVLSWTAGYDFPEEVDGHDVYFGTDFSAVKDATRFSPEYKGSVSVTIFSPGTLDANTTYYWRIDEVKGGHTGASDLSGDRLVDFRDFALLALDWQQPGGTDFNNLSELAGHWLKEDDVCKGYVWKFTTETGQPPAQVTGPSPANDANSVSIIADVSWNAATEATNYDVYFGVTNPPAFLVNQISAIYEPGILDYNTTYYWQIDSNNSFGTTSGDVWNFTTKQQGSVFLITPSTLSATASNESTMYGDRRAINAVNGDGLTGDAHASSVNDNMWTTDYTHNANEWFKVDLAQVYLLDRMKVWNQNQAGYTDRSCKDVDIYYSSLDISNPGDPFANPGNWIFLKSVTLTQAPGTSDYGTTSPVAPDEIDISGTTARWIYLWINNSYGGDYLGLSEVQFFAQ